MSDYHNSAGLSCSGYKAFKVSPKYYKSGAWKAKDTAALRFGSLVHCMVLEPDMAELRYAVAPDVDRRTKDGKAEWAAFEQVNQGKIIVAKSDLEIAMRVMEAARPYIPAGIAEGAVQAETEYGLIKCKPDMYVDGVLYDLKTTSNLAAWERSFWQYGYHYQDTFYRYTCKASFKRKFDPMVFVVVETSEPFDVIIRTLPGHLHRPLTDILERDLARFRDCTASGEWPGLDGDKPACKDVTVPVWVERELEAEAMGDEVCGMIDNIFGGGAE
jgi:hypothetical protein